MANKMKNISMNGKMAYVIMCVEAFLTQKYPEKDWTLVSEKMWKATSENWAEWTDSYCSVVPDVMLQYQEYDKDELESSLSKAEFSTLKKLYSGITEGIEDDPSDQLNYILNKPFELAMVYEGTAIGNGKKAYTIIEQTESILKSNGINLPDYSKVLFSKSDELNGWGYDFDGRFLSVIL